MKSIPWMPILKYSIAAMLGYVVARIVGDIRAFSFERSIDPVAVIALLLTILLSAVFYRRFERLKYSDQLRKDAVIGRLKISVSYLFALEEKCGSGDLGYGDVVKALRRCRREFDGYTTYAIAFGCPVSENSSTKYRLVCSELKDLLTNTPQAGDPSPAIRIVDGKIQLSSDRLVEVERQIDDGKTVLFDIEKSVILDLPQ